MRLTSLEPQYPPFSQITKKKGNRDLRLFGVELMFAGKVMDHLPDRSPAVHQHPHRGPNASSCSFLTRIGASGPPIRRTSRVNQGRITTG